MVFCDCVSAETCLKFSYQIPPIVTKCLVAKTENIVTRNTCIEDDVYSAVVCVQSEDRQRDMAVIRGSEDFMSSGSSDYDS